MEENKNPIIKIASLNVTYNEGKSNEVRALENINLEIFPQEYVIIFGPSGCGKSTLLYIISGLQRPTKGDVFVDEEDLVTSNKKKIAEFRRHKIGMVFQAFYLVPSLNIVDNVCLPKVFADEEPAKRKEMAAKLLERFNISEQSEKFPSELSGGQKQRVSIARSIINNPDIVLADEPVGNLDSKSAHNVMMILKELNENDKKTVILVTHDPSHLQYGNKIVHMKDGKIIRIEIVEKRTGPVDSFIFKDGKVKEELLKQGLIREEIVPSDLKLLMKAFKNLSMAQIGALLVPFKVQQLFSHIFFSMTDEQIETAKKRLQDVLYDKIDYEDLNTELDKDVSKGGAGWDKRNAEKFAKESWSIVQQANKINFSETSRTAAELCDYFISKFSLILNEEKKKKLSEVILDRITNKIGVEEFKKIADMSEKKGGLGFDKRMAQKVAREMEILLLLRY